MLYILGIDVNLLSIIALNRRGFLIYFENRKIRIIDKRIDKIVAYSYIKNDLYKLIKSRLDRAFMSRCEVRLDLA